MIQLVFFCSALYNLSKISTSHELAEFRKKLIDRFGQIPDQANELLDSVKLKWIALKVGIDRYIIKQNKCVCYFIEDHQNNIFKTKTFSIFLSNIQKNKSNIILKEKETTKGKKLVLVIYDINKINAIYKKINLLTIDS